MEKFEEKIIIEELREEPFGSTDEIIDFINSNDTIYTFDDVGCYENIVDEIYKEEIKDNFNNYIEEDCFYRWSSNDYYVVAKDTIIGAFHNLTVWSADKVREAIRNEIEEFKTQLKEESWLRIVDFVYLTGKNVGKINYSSLGRFYNKNYQMLINQNKKYPEQIEMIYLGAFCKANGITKKDIINLIEAQKIFKD